MPIGDDNVIREILSNAKTIVVIGASVKPWRDSNVIMQFLIDVGYKVFPVNPKYIEVLGVPCARGLSALPERMDIVDVFRRSEAVGEIVDEAIAAGAKVIWMQLGIADHDAAARAEHAGLKVIMDHCIRIDYQRLFR
jgi:predicted CoA-binding protein